LFLVFGGFWFFGSFFYVLGFGLGFFRFFSFLGFLGFFILLFGFLFLFSFSVFVILTVVAYCTQLLSQAMYNLMMAAMAETCSR